MNPVGFVITLLAVVFGMVLFRSPTMGTATRILKGMFGASGVLLPAAIYDSLPIFTARGSCEPHLRCWIPYAFKTLAT